MDKHENIEYRKSAKIITTIFASRNKNDDKEALRNLENDSQLIQPGDSRPRIKVDTDLFGLKCKNLFFGRVVALRVLVGRALAIRTQVVNAELGGCKSWPLKKNTAY